MITHSPCLTKYTYNYKSDVWALGCCVYEMTALRHAFDAKVSNNIILQTKIDHITPKHLKKMPFLHPPLLKKALPSQQQLTPGPGNADTDYEDSEGEPPATAGALQPGAGAAGAADAHQGPRPPSLRRRPPPAPLHQGPHAGLRPGPQDQAVCTVHSPSFLPFWLLFTSLPFFFFFFLFFSFYFFFFLLLLLGKILFLPRRCHCQLKKQ